MIHRARPVSALLGAIAARRPFLLLPRPVFCRRSGWPRFRGVAEVEAKHATGVSEVLHSSLPAARGADGGGYERKLRLVVAEKQGTVGDAGDGDGGGRVASNELVGAAGDFHEEVDVLRNIVQRQVVAAMENHSGDVRGCCIKIFLEY